MAVIWFQNACVSVDRKIGVCFLWPTWSEQCRPQSVKAHFLITSLLTSAFAPIIFHWVASCGITARCQQHRITWICSLQYFCTQSQLYWVQNSEWNIGELLKKLRIRLRSTMPPDKALVPLTHIGQPPSRHSLIEGKMDNHPKFGCIFWT